MPTYTRTGLEDLKRLNFWYYQSIARNEDLPEVYDFFSRLFTGQIGDKSILFKNNIKELEQADRLLFKFCFANLMLPYLAHNFQLKSIVLHRHPCAVVASQLNHKGGWLNPKVLSGFSIPDVSNKDLFLKYEDVLASITTVEESLAALWCLNYVVASSVSSQDLLHIEYETLLIDTETTLKKIGQLINVALPYDQILEQVTTPSKTSNTKESIDPQKQIRRWQTALTSKQIDLIVKMVDRFQITKYNEDVVPVT
jgi:hypothetical protein